MWERTLSQKSVRLFCEQKVIDEAKADAYVYGYELLISSVVSVLLVVLIAAVCGDVRYALSFLIGFIPQLSLIHISGGGEETLTAVSTLLAQCSRVGGNLNQLARHFNSGGADTEQLRAKLLDELADLTAFRLHAEKVLGELYGNAQAYRL